MFSRRKPPMGMSALLALAAIPMLSSQDGRTATDWWGDRQLPINNGRRAEKDAAALAKAEAKRQRKADKLAACSRRVRPNGNLTGAPR